MKKRTVTVTLRAPRATVFSFLSNIKNLPEWAPNFCLAVREEGANWKVLTPHGELFFEIDSYARSGVIDFKSGTGFDTLETLPARIMELPSGGCAASFTFFQSEEIPVELHEKHYFGWLNDLRGLLRRFGGGEIHAPQPTESTFYPNLVTARFIETWDFYTEALGFR